MVEETLNRLFYVCGLCGSLVSRTQEEVHDNFHNEARAGAIGISRIENSVESDSFGESALRTVARKVTELFKTSRD